MLDTHDAADEGHDPKQLVARLKSPTPRPAHDAWKGKAEIEVCDPLLAKRLDEQRKKASPGQVRRVYSKPTPAEPASHAAAAPAAAPAACECDAVDWRRASEEHDEPAAEEEHPEPAEQQRPESGAAVSKPDDSSSSALTLPMAACAVAVVAAAAGLSLLLHARLRRV